MKRGRSFTCFLLIILLVVQLVPFTVRAAGDQDPPILLDLFPEKSFFSTDEDDVVVIIAIYFDQSGIDLSDTGMELNRVVTECPYATRRYTTWVQDVSDDYLSSEQQALGQHAIAYKVPIERNLASVQYQVMKLNAADNAQNYAHFGPHASDSSFPLVTFTVDNKIDLDSTLPVVEDVYPDKTDVYPGETIRFNIQAFDDSGIREGSVNIRRQGDWQWLETSFFVQEPDENGNQEIFAEFNVTAATRPGTYELYQLIIMDNSSLNNEIVYRQDSDPYDFVYGTLNFPESFRLQFNVINEDYIETDDPRVTNIELSQNPVLPGDLVNITVTVDDGGTPLTDSMFLRITQEQLHSGFRQIGGINLYQDDDSTYSGTLRIPANWQEKTCSFAYVIYHQDGYNTQYYAYEDESYIAPELAVLSVFSGTDTVSLEPGTLFDPMAGVTAWNVSEGNMTDRIIVQGEVDTSTVGIYLLRYTIISNLPIPDPTKEVDPNGIYHVSRWVGVSEFQVDPSLYESGAPLVVTTDEVFVGADTDEILIEHDGELIDLSGQSGAVLSDEGVYSFFDDAGNVDSSETVAVDEESQQMFAPHFEDFQSLAVDSDEPTILSVTVLMQAPLLFSSSSLEDENSSDSNQSDLQKSQYQPIVVIDRSAPLINYRVEDDTVDQQLVFVDVFDYSPVTRLLYLEGQCVEDDFIGAGESILNEREFTGNSDTMYTIYAEDFLGHATVYTFTLTKNINEPVTELFLNMQLINFTELGETEQLFVVAPSPDLLAHNMFWFSDNEAVATVSDQGVVTAQGDGYAQITVYGYSETTYNWYWATCEVHVNTGSSIVAPSGLTAIARGFFVDLNWDESEVFADGYMVLRRQAGEDNWIMAGGTNQALFRDSALEPETIYEYCVLVYRIFDERQLFSDASNAVTVQTGKANPSPTARSRVGG